MRVIVQNGNKPWRACRRSLAVSLIALSAAACAAMTAPAAPAAPVPAVGPDAVPGAAASGPEEPASVLGAGARRKPAGGAARAPAAPGIALAASRRAQALAAADALEVQAHRIQQRLAAFHHWGLKRPLPARPAPPVLKPRVRGAEVIRRVPTDDKVIFLTIDDGAEKDPEFLRMVRDLDLPVTSFLTDEEARSGVGYEYFQELAALGGGIHNHTLHHPYLPALSYREQRREICGQQRTLKRVFGGPEPRLFRPPYGSYDKDTLRAARDCGLDAVVLWGMEAWANRVDFQLPDREFYPGAIILTHYRGPAEWGGTMADMTRRLLNMAAKQGYTVARLGDYL